MFLNFVINTLVLLQSIKFVCEHCLFIKKTTKYFIIAEFTITTSNKRAQWLRSRIRSPLAKVRSLLSSITEFIFSIQRASTSPSNKMYLRSGLSVGLLTSLKMLERRPSVQSLVSGSNTPYSSITEHACKHYGALFYTINNLL